MIKTYICTNCKRLIVLVHKTMPFQFRKVRLCDFCWQKHLPTTDRNKTLPTDQAEESSSLPPAA